MKRSSPLVISTGLGGLVVIGTIALLTQVWPTVQSDRSRPTLSTELGTAPSRVVALASQDAATRGKMLASLAQQGIPQEQNQARYVLAADALRGGDGEVALQWLENLESYTPLTPHVLTNRAQAYTITNQVEKAQATWSALLQEFPDQPAAAEALYALGQTEPERWQQLQQQFSKHPLSVVVARQQLKDDPNNRAALLVIAQAGFHLPDYRTYLDRLTKTFGPDLTPAEWQTVGFGYWEKLLYKEAGQAYSRAPATAHNLYRAGRSLQIAEQKAPAIALFQKLVTAFPQAEETPRGLIRLADLSQDSTQAIAYLDQAIQQGQAQQQPEASGDALSRKIRRLKQSPQQQATAEQQLLNTFSQTDAAAELRWETAWQAAQDQQLKTALKVARDIASQNPDSPRAPQALFWAGRWADRLGQTQERQQHFTQLWQRYPESYYAWRAGSLSGWPIGDFQSLRTQNLSLEAPPQRLTLPVGSATLRELYALGEAQTAWQNWQVEFQSRDQPSLSEQLTDGLVRLGVGEYLDGIFMLENLGDRTRLEPNLSAADKQLYTTLRSQPGYWQALYPQPYWNEVQLWAQKYTVNPVLALGLMRQESRFQPKIRSVVGATGLMQLMPETAAEVARQLDMNPYNLENPADNIRLGTHYLASTHQTYQDNTMLAIASYNAGPGNVDDWLHRFNSQDADKFVELIPFPETNGYVKKVLGNYWNYLRLYSPTAQRALSEAIGQTTPPSN